MQNAPPPIVPQPMGLAVLNKPVGMTSRAAVDCVLRAVRPAKVGHAGTLDPLASGVLVVCIGGATRLIEYVQHQPKQYQARFLLGRYSDTEDLESEVTLLPDARPPSLEELQQAAAALVGVIQQRPPAYSALKVDGQRAYALARKGREVELAARPIEIHELVVTGYEYPEVALDITCGSGTYVRSLGRDLAISLGSNAVMSHLVRTAIGPFTIVEAVTPYSCRELPVASWLRPAREAVAALPQVVLSAEQSFQAANGLAITAAAPQTPGEIAALDESGQLVALLTWRANGELRAARSFMEQMANKKKSRPLLEQALGG